MIVVKVELHSAITGKVTSLCEAVIYNDGTGTGSRGNYIARFGKKGQSHYAAFTKPWRETRVIGFARLRLQAWYLVRDALQAALKERQ